MATMLCWLPLLLPLLVNAETTTPNTGDQTLGFIFGFTTSSLVVPITPSCPEPLTISPITPLDTSGAGDTKGPFNMLFLVREQMLTNNGTLVARNYAHQESFAEMRDVQQVQDFPLMNGSQFIACAWSSNLVSGGCQDLFTVTPSDNYALSFGSRDEYCRATNVLGSWIPPPEKILDVKLEGPSGVVSEVGWPACCTDLMFTPQNGTPPYTLIISPTQHPPVNISSEAITSTAPADHHMNYTIRYTHGQAFMVSMFDSNGSSWAAGPLHAGQSLGGVECLQVRTGEKAPEVIGKKGAIGGIVGGTIGALVLGILLGWLAGVLLNKRKNKYTRPRESEHNPYLDPRPARSSESIKGTSRVSPYALLDTDHPSPPPPSSAASNQNQNVYVVHADGGGEDLHIRLPTPGARVIEMPPDYVGSGTPPPGQGGKGGRPRMGMSLSSGSREPGIEEGVESGARRDGASPVSPVRSQVTSEKSRQ